VQPIESAMTAISKDAPNGVENIRLPIMYQQVRRSWF
jgi:hypothetical protein